MVQHQSKKLVFFLSIKKENALGEERFPSIGETKRRQGRPDENSSGMKKKLFISFRLNYIKGI